MKREHKQACVVGISRGLLAEACSRPATLLSAMQIFQARLHYMTIRSRRKMTYPGSTPVRVSAARHEVSLSWFFTEIETWLTSSTTALLIDFAHARRVPKCQSYCFRPDAVLL